MTTMTRPPSSPIGDVVRSRSSAPLAWVLTGVVILVTGFVALDGLSSGGTAVDLLWLVLPPLYAVLGSIIVSRSRSNRVGWLLIAIGGAMALDLESLLGAAAVDVAPSQLTLGWFLFLVGDQVSWMTWLFPLFLLLCVFPTGRLLSARWRWVPVLEIVMFTTLTGLIVFGEEIGPMSEAWAVSNPIGIVDGGFLDSLVVVIPWALGLGALASGP